MCSTFKNPQDNSFFWKTIKKLFFWIFNRFVITARKVTPWNYAKIRPSSWRMEDSNLEKAGRKRKLGEGMLGGWRKAWGWLLRLIHPSLKLYQYKPNPTTLNLTRVEVVMLKYNNCSESHPAAVTSAATPYISISYPRFPSSEKHPSKAFREQWLDLWEKIRSRKFLNTF